MKRVAWMITVMLGISLSASRALAGPSLDVGRLTPDVSPFLAAGCVDNDAKQGFLCPPEVFKRFGCSDLRLAPGAGGLGMPIAACVGKAGGKEGPGVAVEGCMLRIPIRYVVYTTKGFRVLRTAAELLSIALPIDTPEKAASLVMALNPRVVLEPPTPGPDTEIRVRGGDGRRAAAVKDSGIAVRLFEQQPCGCGTHPVSAVEYAVTPAGEIRELGRRVIQERKTKICVD